MADKYGLQVITPVKNSFATAENTFRRIAESVMEIPFDYTIYNDFSDDETARSLQSAALEYKFRLVNLSEITNHPSPNYRLVLQLAQQKAIETNAHLLIVESDVLVTENTLSRLYNCAAQLPDAGLIAAVTTDKDGTINFPYLYAKSFKKGVLPTKKRLSFSCTLLTNSFLRRYDFSELDETKSWYDVFISRKACKLGFTNYLDTLLPVIHLPHSSRPWKQLKYVNPVKYYWRKYTQGLDKI